MNSSVNKMNNAGFSLVELIVAMLITSVVSLSVMAFVSLSTREYTTTNSEVGIQVESSAAEDFITKTLREATDYKFITNGQYKSIALDGTETMVAFDNPILFVRGAEVSKGSYKYTMFVCYADEKALLYKTEVTSNKNTFYADDGTIDTSKLCGIANTMVSNYKSYFLADHVESISVAEVTRDLSAAPTTYVSKDDNKVVKVTMSYKYGSKSFSHEYDIKFRNAVK